MLEKYYIKEENPDSYKELKEDKDEYQLRKQVVNLVMKEKSVPISIAQEFFETRTQLLDIFRRNRKKPHGHDE